ncbi:MAG: hypothetical protein ACFFD4_35695, partial [Candidatus Odinarchaeota archaeon]
ETSNEGTTGVELYLETVDILLLKKHGRIEKIKFLLTKLFDFSEVTFKPIHIKDGGTVVK